MRVCNLPTVWYVSGHDISCQPLQSAEATSLSGIVSISTSKVERVMGIEPTPKAWEAFVLPLNYTRQIPWKWTHFSPEGRNNIHPLGGLSQRPILRQATSWKSAPFRVRAIISSPILAITARHSLSPRSFTHSSMSLSCERPRPRYSTKCGGIRTPDWAYHVPSL
ncbi:MAG: hypothetical protein RLZ25_1482 [Pseudomonadota bacterium]